jgi:hypothetical protein
MSTPNVLVACKHPYAVIRQNKLDREHALVAYNKFLTDLVSKDACFNLNVGKHALTKCCCLHDLRGGEDQERLAYAAEHMWHFHNLNGANQHRLVTQWIRLKDKTNKKRPYQLPVRGRQNEPPSDALQTTYPICKNALQSITQFGRNKFKTSTEAAQTNVDLIDWRVGRKSNNAMKPGTHADLHEFFQEMMELAAPRATRIVQDETGTGLRDQDIEVKELPTHFTKRGMYYRYGSDRGHNIELKDHRGNLQVSPRAHDDDKEVPLWPTGSVSTDIVSWKAFRNFWKRNYSKLILPNARHDICGECFILANSFRYRKRTTSNGEGDSDGDSDADPDNEQQDPDFAAREVAIDNANKHCKRSVCQRKLANEKIAKAKEDKLNNVPHSSRTYTFIADYSQNLDLPHFGGEQPGETFYYSPLNIFQFGVVDPTDNDKLHAFVYDEGDGKKGGNNVASLILKLLRLPAIDLIEKGEAGGELNFILDNCSGQNKNRMVLRLANLLVESGIFWKVNFLFLVRGHTKNPCDRMFNILKLRFRKQNVYTMEQLLEVLNAQDQVNALRVQSSDFYDMDAFLDKFYRRFASGTVHKAHIFSCNMDDGATKIKINVSEWELEDEPEVKTDLKKQARYTDFGELTREEALKQWKPQLLEAPGIPPIKRCELYNKYRPLVPQPYRDTICPKPPQEILDNQKKIKNDKVRAKAHAKKKKPAKTKEKENTADETREDGEEEGENVMQQVAAAAAAAGPLFVPAAAAAPPVMTWIPHQFVPSNSYLYGGFNPFTNSFNSNL